jgi:hypothetical protein
MPTPRYYSPQLRRDLITKLYYRAKADKIPMTRLANRLLDEAMTNVVPLEDQSCRVAETTSPEPPHAGRN